MKGSPNYGYADSPYWNDRMAIRVVIDDWENDESPNKRFDCAGESHTFDQSPWSYPVPKYPIKASSSIGTNFRDGVHIEKRIKKLVESGGISEARRFLSFIQCGVSERIDHWRRVLAKPRSRSEKMATGANFEKDASWLVKNSFKYKDQWVALNQGLLLGSHKSRVELHRRLKKAGKLRGAMFFKVEQE